jgi:hypothetical protein
MLPWAHAAVGYLLYSAYSRWRVGWPPVGLTVYAVGLGTQFPDVIDKPLAWSFAVLPSGRSLGHSLLTLVAVLILLRVACRYPDQRALSAAFGVGYISHLFADGIGSVIAGDFGELEYLLWPVIDVPTGESRSFIEFFLALEPTPMMLAGMILTIVGGVVWVYDGMPGVKDLLVAYHHDTDEIEQQPKK